MNSDLLVSTEVYVNKVFLIGRLSKKFQEKSYKNYFIYEAELELCYQGKASHVKLVIYSSKYNYDLTEKCNKLFVGDMLHVEGSISSKKSSKESYTETYYNSSVVVRSVEVLSNRKNEEEDDSSLDDDIPF